MKHIDTVIIGGGQAGLAMSYCLAARGIDHVVLERGRVGERWRSERWDSLRLLTPRWQSRLPGWRYRGLDPHGYMTMPEVIDYLQGYAGDMGAPVHEHTTVCAVTAAGPGYRVDTDREVWLTSNVVIATGHCDVPAVPAFARRLPHDVMQVTPTEYRNPGQLPDGGVLVVGASASGLQLADELQASGRPVTVAVGSHTRVPRTYRGHDIMMWLETAGVMGEAIDPTRDVAVARRQPSLQLVGRPDHVTLDLSTLQQQQVRLLGRLEDIDGTVAAFAQDLHQSTARAEAKLGRLLDRIDEYVRRNGLTHLVPEPGRLPRVVTSESPTRLDLRAEHIRTVVWATGFRRRYPWLRVPVLDASGEIRHEGGIVPAPGMYVLGLPFLCRRNSSFIDGVGNDARALAHHIAARLGQVAAAA